MPKSKAPPGGKHPPHRLARHHLNHNVTSPMDQVKIKRVKRNKKKTTTKEKVLAGLGLGASMLGGGVAMGNAKTNQTQFTATQKQDQTKGSTTAGIKDKLKKIFGETLGVQTAQAAEIGTQGIMPDGTWGTWMDDGSGNIVLVSNSLLTNDPRQQGVNPTLLSPNQSATASATASTASSSSSGSGSESGTTGTSATAGYGSALAGSYSAGSGSSSAASSEPAYTPPAPSTETPPAPVTRNTVSLGATLVGTVTPDINNANKGTVTINGQTLTVDVLPDGRIFDSTGQDVTAQFATRDAQSIRDAINNAAPSGSGQASSTSEVSPQTTLHNAYDPLAPAISVTSGSSTAGVDVIPTPESANPITPTAPQEGNTKIENGFNYTYYQGAWVLDNGQTKTDSNGFQYGSNGGQWILLDGQTKTESGTTYVSAGGQWVAQTAAGATASGSELNAKYGISSFDPGTTYVLGNDGQWVAQAAPAPSGPSAGVDVIPTPESANPITPTAPQEGNTKIENGFNYTYYQGAWVL
ncbi:MAG: hypothetical protein KGJ93_05505, partial [Patescibacteria group bacterium]|nr:hypothetical protein [Patescibacteria group bacterium]